MPRIHRRQLPVPTRAQLAARAVRIARVATLRLTPLGIRQGLNARRGMLPASEVARPFRRMCEDLGGTFMKFGQLVASSPGLFSEPVSDEFRSCLDTGPVVPLSVVRTVIEDDLGFSLGEAFADIEPEPVGRASIAVVYRGRLHDGRTVAVKVLRPGIELAVATDLEVMVPLAALVAHHTGEQMAGSVLQLLDGLRQQLGEELDLRNEAGALARFRLLQAEAGLDHLVVPEPFTELSGPRVLTMEWLDGVAVDDLGRAAAMGVDPGPLVAEVLRAFFATTVRWGAFHGDLHAGNMLVLRDGRLGIIDWGIVGRLDHATHEFFIRLLEAVLGDETAWAGVTAHLTAVYGRAIQVGLGLDDDQLAVFLRNLVEPALTRPFGEVSLYGLLQAPLTQAAVARGAEAHRHSARQLVTRVRNNRRMRRIAERSGGIMSDFTRGAFLLTKQLMYFDRYGKLFMSDRPILADREWVARLVASARADGPERGPVTREDAAP